jgi:hypothetical protein
MICLACGRKLENDGAYQIKVGNFTYMLCEECFKKSGAIEGSKRIETHKSKHNCRYRKLLDVALSIVEGQEQNETLWPENSSPREKVLQRELRWLHEIIKKVKLYQAGES